MIFVKENLPDPVTYFENEGLKLTGRGPWRNTSCVFHGGRDSMQIKIESGGFCCMNCGVKGGDVLAYHQQAYNLDFTQAAKELGAWIDDGKPHAPQKPRPLSAADSIRMIDYEVGVLLFTLLDILNGNKTNDVDKARALIAAQRIRTITGSFQ